MLRKTKDERRRTKRIKPFLSSLVPRPSSFVKRSSERGVALIIVVVVMLTMALIGTSLMELSSAVNFSVDNILNETKARYLAEAGIAHALHEIRNNADLSKTLDENGNPILYPLGEGFYSVSYNPSESLITCTGIVNETKKTMQLQYNVL